MSHPGVDRYLTRLIRENVRKVIGRFGFTQGDRADLEHDLLAHVLLQISKYDPARGAKATFYASLVRNRLRTILAIRRKELRNMPVGAALNEPIEDSDGDVIERIELLGDEEYRRATAAPRRPAEDLRDLRIDLHRAIASLPTELQETCLLLLHQTITEVAAGLGITRPTIYRRIRKIRSRFPVTGSRTTCEANHFASLTSR